MKTRIDLKKPEARVQKILRLREAFPPASPTPVPPGDDDPAARVERSERFGHHLGRLQAGGSPSPSLVHGVFPGRSSPVIQRSSKDKGFEKELKQDEDDEENVDPEDTPEPSAQDRFIAAISQGDLEKAEEIFKQGDVDINGDEGIGTALYQAAGIGNEAAVKYLLEKNADPDLGNDEDETPLQAAIKGRSPATVALLLDKNADPDKEDPNGDAPIILALADMLPDIARLLIQHQANPNVQSSLTKKTPLHYAVEANDHELAKLLLEHGARMTEENDQGKIPLEDESLKKETRGVLRKGFPEELKTAFVEGFKVFLAKNPPVTITVSPKLTPEKLAETLQALAKERAAKFQEAAASLAGEHERLARADIGTHTGALEDNAPQQDALKFLGHVHSLSGKKASGFGSHKIDLEGFTNKSAIYHNILALQSYLVKVGSDKDSGKKGETVAARIETLIRSYQRSFDFQIAETFFKGLGFDNQEEAERAVHGALAEAISGQEIESGSEFVLPVGFSGKEEGHAIYLGGGGDFKKGQGQLTVHNLGVLSDNHPKGEPKGNLQCSFPFAITEVSQGKDLTAWLTSVISALVKEESGPAEQALYKDSSKLGKTPDSQELGKKLSPQTQQVVGNCSVKNLHSFLLTSLQLELGPEDGAKLYKEIKGHVKEFAETSARSFVQEENVGFSQAIQEIFAKDLPQKRLRNAVLKGNNKKLSEILSSGGKIDVNDTGDEKRTLLEIAIEQNNPDGAALLLGQGAQVTTQIRKALVFAVFKNQEELFKALLSAKLDASADFHDGMTLLHIAVAEPSVSLNLITLFLKSVNPNVKDDQERTPLHLAASRKRKDVALLLLENGADPKIPSKTGQLPFQIAEEKGDSELAGLLKPKD